MVEGSGEGWTRVLGGSLERPGSFRAVGGDVAAPWLPHTFHWRGERHEVAHAEPLGRRFGPSFETAREAYVRGHRVHLTTHAGLELIVEGLRGAGREARWRVLAVRTP